MSSVRIGGFGYACSLLDLGLEFLILPPEPRCERLVSWRAAEDPDHVDDIEWRPRRVEGRVPELNRVTDNRDLCSAKGAAEESEVYEFAVDVIVEALGAPQAHRAVVRTPR